MLFLNCYDHNNPGCCEFIDVGSTYGRALLQNENKNVEMVRNSFLIAYPYGRCTTREFFSLKNEQYQFHCLGVSFKERVTVE